MECPLEGRTSEKKKHSVIRFILPESVQPSEQFSRFNQQYGSSCTNQANCFTREKSLKVAVKETCTAPGVPIARFTVILWKCNALSTACTTQTWLKTKSSSRWWGNIPGMAEERSAATSSRQCSTSWDTTDAGSGMGAPNLFSLQPWSCPSWFFICLDR